jgi:hypothetical protein
MNEKAACSCVRSEQTARILPQPRGKFHSKNKAARCCAVTLGTLPA